MENEDKEFWNALLTNGSLRSRFIRDLEIQSIVSHSTEDLAIRYHEEEMLPRHAAYSSHSVAASRS
jgi:hypothetical protein